MWPHECLVDLQVRWTTAQSLHIDTPFLRIQIKCLERTRLAGKLNGVYVLISTVVASTWVTLRVLIRHRRAKSIEDCPGGEILRGNENNGFTLTLDLSGLRSPGVSIGTMKESAIGKKEQ